jgi:hypothetical protein
MKKHKAGDDFPWQKTQYANLVRYRSSGSYFARIRIGGKLIRRSLKTKVLSVAKLRLADQEKDERQLAENHAAESDACINKHKLGAGNWTGGIICEKTNMVGRVSYNGRVWPA